jgi:dGTPase
MPELAPYAASDGNSRGRCYQESAPTYRSEYQRDRDRIIHCAAFRRLEYKTQVFVNHEGDLFRTRLTHSIEVAQIARSIARTLTLNEDLTEAIALAHDLGHTPFGHAGQDALNDCMRDYGGFEHNLQSLRVVDKLEERYAEFPGLNLTFETREGILKHCSLNKARDLGEIGKRFLDKTQTSLEAQVANLADEIAYNNHDVDDGLRAEMISIEQLCEIDLFGNHHAVVQKSYPGLPPRRIIHEVVRRMINDQVVDLVEESRARIAHAVPGDIEAVRSYGKNLIGFSTAMQARSRSLKQFLHTHLYRHYRVTRMSAKAGRILSALFEAFMDNIGLLPPEAARKATAPEQLGDKSDRARAVADYIAGMTDRYAIAEYEKVFGPAQLT